jgi:hypothetical protein
VDGQRASNDFISKPRDDMHKMEPVSSTAGIEHLVYVIKARSRVGDIEV